jgi:predicted phage terminase large subunit-like protein
LPRKSHKGLTTLYSEWLDTARDSQITPVGDWAVWLILAGRGWGKTRTGGADAALYALKNPNTRVAVVVPTFGDLKRVAFGGESGILSYLPRECLLAGRGQGYNNTVQEIRLFNGSIIQGFAATEPERLRGPQFHRAWCDEIAAWPYPETFDQLMFGLRLGENPQCVITTTPKPTPLIKNLLKRTGTVITRGSTFDNADNLAAGALTQLKEKYEGTRLGRQELYAEVLEDIEGALWNWNMIESSRVKPENVPDLQRVVVAVDPAVTNTETSDETGIIVAGRCANGKYYVLEDRSLHGSPDGWAREAVRAFHKYNADRLIAEVNNGGDLVEKVVRTIDREIPYTAVRASRGKIIRAEPVAALYEQGKVHHVGEFKALEDQLTSFTPEGRVSPDRLDALVWALTDLTQQTGQPAWRIS